MLKNHRSGQSWEREDNKFHIYSFTKIDHKTTSGPYINSLFNHVSDSSFFLFFCLNCFHNLKKNPA